MEEGLNNEEDQEKEKTAENEDESAIHRYITENEYETNQDNFDEGIE